MKMRLSYEPLQIFVLLLAFFLLLNGYVLAAGKQPRFDPNTKISEPIIVPGPGGVAMKKTNIFIGDVDENSTHAVRNSASFTKDTYGTNYCSTPDQKNAVENLITHLPKETRVNLIGYGDGGGSAAVITVDLAQRHRIDVLVTIDPSGPHPDFSLVKQSANKWVNVGTTGNKNDKNP